jgi:hypothetical protein
MRGDGREKEDGKEDEETSSDASGPKGLNSGSITETNRRRLHSFPIPDRVSLGQYYFRRLMDSYLVIRTNAIKLLVSQNGCLVPVLNAYP